jgi:hypothetical protein
MTIFHLKEKRDLSAAFVVTLGMHHKTLSMRFAATGRNKKLDFIVD